MKQKTIDLELTQKQAEILKSHYQQVIAHLEKDKPLRMDVLSGLQQAMSTVVKETPRWQAVLQAVAGSDDHTCLHLLHKDNEILNLPWSLALDPVSGNPLGQVERLYLAKSIPGIFKAGKAALSAAAPPLKVLLMIASPEDSEWKERLSYEEEEFEILQAFDPLMRSGLVEIDFTDDGSLESLERKLAANRYHILHFSGHATYNKKKETGYLEMEDPLSLKKARVEAKDFAAAVNSNPRYRVPMVVLSSCRTAQGGSEAGLKGVTNHLLLQGVTAVISMGLSIIDRYAARFSAHFYGKIAEKQTIHTAFSQALRFLKEQEFSDQVKDRVKTPVPLQWLIPQLYLSREMTEVVDWRQPVEKLDLSSNRYLFEKDRLLLPHEKDYLFIGRRKEKARMLRPFFDKRPILLKGQGGVGKTALAEHLVQRLIAANPKTEPFVFNEKTKTIDEILKRLQHFVEEKGELSMAELSLREEAMDRFRYLLARAAEICRPVFIFDNLESFQAGFGQEFAPEFSDLREVIAYLCDSAAYHIILTCRYPLPGFANLHSFDLNLVGLNDFWKKALYLDVGHINTYLRQAAEKQKEEGLPPDPMPPFIEIVRLLHETFGGSYRALEFFNQLLKENPGKIKDSLASLEEFRKESKSAAAAVKQQMGRNLLFARLMSLLEARQLAVLRLLANFRAPVQELALQLLHPEQEKEAAPRPPEPTGIDDINQSPPPEGCSAGVGWVSDWPDLFAGLHRLTLIEVSAHPETGLPYFYVTPIVKDLLQAAAAEAAPYPFSHVRAGSYYYHVFHNIDGSLTPLEEAFYHFHEAADKEKVQEIGNRLSGFYDDISMYHNAFFYAGQVYELLGEETKGVILNRLGTIYNLLGEYEQALNIQKKALKKCRKSGDKKAEGTLLHNIGSTYQNLSDYPTAQKFLRESLDIRKEIKDKKGEISTLHDICMISMINGDMDTAQKNLERSISNFDIPGEEKSLGIILSNLARIHFLRGDDDIASSYLERALENIKKIGAKEEEGTLLNNMGSIYLSRHDYDTALKYFEQGLQVKQEVGEKKGEAAVLNNISQVHEAQNNYDSALRYLERSLKIKQDIGDKSGICMSLYNMSSIAYKTGNVEKIIEYAIPAYEIAIDINDAVIIYNLGRDFGAFLAMSGAKEAVAQGVTMLERSLQIGKKAGFPDVGEIEEFLRLLKKKN